MEKFAVYIKANSNAEKIRRVNIDAFDHYQAHYNILKKINIQREDIVNIKDSKGTEVFNLDQGFLFDE
jgi:hypothetical protein